MKKINLKPYKAEDQNGKKVPYNVKDIMVNLLYHPSLSLNSVELLKNTKVAQKIENAKKDYVILEEAEYKILKECLAKIRGLGRNDVEFVRRIEEAEDYEIK